jgi:putative membrane protein
MMGGFGLGSLGWIGMILNFVIILAVLGGIVWLVVWGAGRLSTGAGWSAASGQSAREILQARYARGELSREQYQQMLADLD